MSAGGADDAKEVRQLDHEAGGLKGGLAGSGDGEQLVGEFGEAMNLAVFGPGVNHDPADLGGTAAHFGEKGVHGDAVERPGLAGGEFSGEAGGMLRCQSAFGSVGHPGGEFLVQKGVIGAGRGIAGWGGEFGIGVRRDDGQIHEETSRLHVARQVVSGVERWRLRASH